MDGKIGLANEQEDGATRMKAIGRLSKNGKANISLASPSRSKRFYESAL